MRNEVIITYPPRSLYRYRSLSTRPNSGHEHGYTKWQDEVASLNRAYLWCGSFTKLNDPMEGHYQSNSRVRRSAQYNRIREQIRDGKLNQGICSFSETHDNGPMWAHYADEFHGICVEYDLRRLVRNLSKLVHIYGCQLVRVTYSEDPFQLTLSALVDSEAARQILAFKSHKWQNEREWRLFKAGCGSLEIDPKCIKCVYTGNQMEKAQFDQLRSELPREIPIRKMKLSGYSIGFGPSAE